MVSHSISIRFITLNHFFGMLYSSDCVSFRTVCASRPSVNQADVLLIHIPWIQSNQRSYSNSNIFNLSRPKSEQIMADIGSALDRLSRTYGATLSERYSDDTTGGFVAIRECKSCYVFHGGHFWVPPGIPSPTSNDEDSAWNLKRAGFGRARTKKAAKKMANEDLYNQLPAPGNYLISFVEDYTSVSALTIQ